MDYLIKNEEAWENLMPAPGTVSLINKPPKPVKLLFCPALRLT